MNDINKERFVLRILEKKYINDLYRLLSDDEVTKYLNMETHKSVNDTILLFDDYLDEYNRGLKYPFEIIDKSNDKFVGVFLIKLDLYDEDCFEFTIYLDKEYWGRGIYKEVIPYMISFAFDNIKTSNFRGFVMEENLASRKVLEYTNFRLEKVFDVDGIDGKIYSYLITREDYLKNKGVKNMFNLKGRVAVVTGASSGLGMQMARAFANQGADLVILARRVERLEEFKKELETLGVRVLALKCDVTSTEDINNAAAEAERVFGKVDILVNCAGSSKDKGVLDMNDEEWDFTIATDETSVFKMTRAFGNIMKKNNYGRVINIASMYGMVGNAEIPTIAYHSSKGAVVNFTRAAAAELAPHGITVNCICPGYFYTELTTAVLDTEMFQAFAQSHVPMKRYGKEGELNAAAIFLASDEATYVTGVILPVDGGYTCV